MSFTTLLILFGAHQGVATAGMKAMIHGLCILFCTRIITSCGGSGKDTKRDGVVVNKEVVVVDINCVRKDTMWLWYIPFCLKCTILSRNERKVDDFEIDPSQPRARVLRICSWQ